jgi:glycosyltransferase involved in cell wall biosynthesis
VRGNNPAGKQELIDIGITADRVGMITPPVDETVFKPMPQTEARLKTDLPLNVYVALFVGRMVDSKGVEIAVGTTLLVKRSDVIFVFIGEGPLQHLVEEAGVNDKRIRIVGNVKHHELVYYYNAADILICAPVDSELLAFVAREALMCGLPILAPNVAVYFNIPYRVNPTLVPSSVGCLLEPTPEAFATSLEELVSLKITNGASFFDRQVCRKHALQHYSSCAMDWLGDSYQKAIQMRSSKILKSFMAFLGRGKFQNEAV